LKQEDIHTVQGKEKKIDVDKERYHTKISFHLNYPQHCSWAAQISESNKIILFNRD